MYLLSSCPFDKKNSLECLSRFLRGLIYNALFSTRFVKGRQPGRGTGFDINEKDLLEMKRCRGIVVASTVFGHSLMLLQ